MESDQSNKPKPEKSTVIKRVEIKVLATQCLWFAWADPGFPGVEGESDTAAYRPYEVPAEKGATSVRITAATTAQDKWRHDPDPGRESGANGLNGTGGIPNDQRGLENPNYRREAELHSLYLQELTTHLNKLVGVMESNDSAPTSENPYNQLPIGASYLVEGDEFPANATRLWLGFHDGREWSNNQGSITVTVEWIS